VKYTIAHIEVNIHAKNKEATHLKETNDRKLSVPAFCFLEVIYRKGNKNKKYFWEYTKIVCIVKFFLLFYFFVTKEAIQ
jgi:hypothetical protein